MDSTNPHLWGDCECSCHGRAEAAPPLDRERLAKAIERSEAARGLSPQIGPGYVAQVYLDSADRIIREYAALAAPQSDLAPKETP